MKRTTKKAVSILAASALLALTLAGCGNDTTTDTASDTTEDTSASTPLRLCGHQRLHLHGGGYGRAHRAVHERQP